MLFGRSLGDLPLAPKAVKRGTSLSSWLTVSSAGGFVRGLTSLPESNIDIQAYVMVQRTTTLLRRARKALPAGGHAAAARLCPQAQAGLWDEVARYEADSHRNARERLGPGAGGLGQGKA